MSIEYDPEHRRQERAAVGEPVTDFFMEIYDPQQGFFGIRTLEALRETGKWTILFFYPADFTFVCPTELADLAACYEDLKALDAEVLSVSTDTKYTHLAWQKKERLLADVRFPMASDPTGEISEYFGVYDEDSGLALRGTFIISPEGVLVSSEVNSLNVGRNVDELVRKMQAHHYLRDHPDEACPSKWTLGRRTLTPSEALVGNVYDSLK